MFGMPNGLGIGGIGAGGGIANVLEGMTDWRAANPQQATQLDAFRGYLGDMSAYNQAARNLSAFNAAQQPTTYTPGDYTPVVVPPAAGLSPQDIQSLAQGRPALGSYFQQGGGGAEPASQGSAPPDGSLPLYQTPAVAFGEQGWASSPRPNAIHAAQQVGMGTSPMDTLNAQLAALQMQQNTTPTNFAPYTTAPMLPAEITAPLYGFGSFISSPYNIMGVASSLLPLLL